MENRKRHRAISRCWVDHQRVLDRRTSVASHDDLDTVRNASIDREREKGTCLGLLALRRRHM